MDYQPLDQTVRDDLQNRMNDINSFQSPITGTKNTGIMKNPEALNNSFLENNDIVGGAIAAKSRAMYEPQQQMQKAQRELGGYGVQQQDLARTANYGLGVLKLDNARYAAMNQRRVNEEAQRAQMIGSILGIAGIVGGAYLGGQIGGPGGIAAGAMAGQAAGSGLGRSISYG